MKRIKNFFNKHSDVFMLLLYFIFIIMMIFGFVFLVTLLPWNEWLTAPKQYPIIGIGRAIAE